MTSRKIKVNEIPWIEGNREWVMDNLKKTFNVILGIIVAVIIVVVVFILSGANIYHYTSHMEADIASETLLAKEIYDNGYSQPDTWVMSTAMRIIGPPRLAAFIYPYTGFDLNVSMGLACSLLMIILVGTMLFFSRQMGLGILESLVMVLLCLVLSESNGETQRMLYLYASYYVGHFISMFIVYGLYARSLKNGKLTPWVIITLPLAYVNGMQGIHASIFFYLPLFGIECLRRIVLLIKKKKDESLLISFWVAAITAIAFFTAQFLGTYMRSETSRNIRHAPEKFFDVVLPLFKQVLGYGRMQWLVIIFIVIGMAGYILAVANLKEKPWFWAAIPIPCGFITFVLSTTFSTAEAAPRYYLMQVFAVAVGVAMLMNLFKPTVTMWAAVAVAFYGVISAGVFYQDLVQNDSSASSEYVKMADWMEDSGYLYGYSTFDHANTMTVMCNDAVKIRPVNSLDKMEGMKWLSNAIWYPPYKDVAGKTCYVVSKAKEEDFSAFVSDKHPTIVETKEFDSFTVYVLDHDYTLWVQ